MHRNADALRMTSSLDLVNRGPALRAVPKGAQFSPSWTAFQRDRRRRFRLIVDGVSAGAWTIRRFVSGLDRGHAGRSEPARLQEVAGLPGRGLRGAGSGGVVPWGNPSPKRTACASCRWTAVPMITLDSASSPCRGQTVVRRWWGCWLNVRAQILRRCPCRPRNTRSVRRLRLRRGKHPSVSKFLTRRRRRPKAHAASY